jgi:hypothetical protein
MYMERDMLGIQHRNPTPTLPFSNCSSLIFFELDAVYALHVYDYTLNAVALLIRITKEQ